VPANRIVQHRKEIHEGKNDPQKIEKTLDVLFCGLKASSIAWASFMEASRLVNCSFDIKKIFSAANFFTFWLSKRWIRISFQPEMLDPDLDPYQMNTDPKH
jgi:hypothetical protein